MNLKRKTYFVFIFMIGILFIFNHLLAQDGIAFPYNTIIAQAKRPNSNTLDTSLKIGDIYLFADREWLVMDIQSDKMLIITKNITEKRRFDVSLNIWVDSELREYLNDDFYHSIIDIDRERILPHSNGDKIFLFSKEEAERYFKHYSQIIPRDHQRMATAWWLRSPGNSSRHCMFVDSYGNIRTDGPATADHYGVRPSLWLEIK